MHAALHVFVPKLESASPAVTPRFVQIEQEVEAAMQLPFFDVVEIDVNVEPSPRASEMHPSAFEGCVCQEVFDARDVLEVREESRR